MEGHGLGLLALRPGCCLRVSRPGASPPALPPTTRSGHPPPHPLVHARNHPPTCARHQARSRVARHPGDVAQALASAVAGEHGQQAGLGACEAVVQVACTWGWPPVGGGAAGSRGSSSCLVCGVARCVEGRQIISPVEQASRVASARARVARRMVAAGVGARGGRARVGRRRRRASSRLSSAGPCPAASAAPLGRADRACRCKRLLQPAPEAACLTQAGAARRTAITLAAGVPEPPTSSGSACKLGDRAFWYYRDDVKACWAAGLTLQRPNQGQHGQRWGRAGSAAGSALSMCMTPCLGWLCMPATASQQPQHLAPRALLQALVRPNSAANKKST